MRTILAVSLVTVATAIAPATHADAAVRRAAPDGGSVAIRLLNDGAAATGTVGDVYIVAQRGPGRTVTRRVAVTNGSRHTLSVRIYPGAAQLVGDTFTPLPAGVTNELVGWTSVSPDVVTLAPGTTRTATVSIRVPSDARLGSRYGVVWAEVRDPGRARVTLVSRVGVRVFLSTGVPSGVGERFTVDAPRVGRRADHQFAITTRVRNVGDASINVRGTLAMTRGPGGVRTGPFDLAVADTIGRGDDAVARVVLPRHIPTGRWHVDVVLRSASGLTRHAVADLELSGSRRDSDASRTAVLLATVALVVALFAAGLGAARRHAQRRARTRRVRTTVLTSGRRARRRNPRHGSRRARHRHVPGGADAHR
jgi:hypothetical protein